MKPWLNFFILPGIDMYGFYIWKELGKNLKLKQILLFKNLPKNKFKKESFLIKKQKLNIARCKNFISEKNGLVNVFQLHSTVC